MLKTVGKLWLQVGWHVKFLEVKFSLCFCSSDQTVHILIFCPYILLFLRTETIWIEQ